MKYGVSRSTLLITAGVVWLCRTEYSAHWDHLLAGRRTILAVQSVRGESGFPAFLCLYFPKAVQQAYPENQSEKRTEQLSVFLFRPQGMDHHGPDDSDGNHHPRPPFITGKLHCRLLHRIIGCTECNRHPLPPVLVD